MVKKDIINVIRRWEQKNLVWGLGYYDKWKGTDNSLSANMCTRGYDGFKVSNSITKKWGLKYRKVWGFTVSPAYKWVSINGKRVSKTMVDSKGKYIPKVEWYHQGYLKAGKTKGVFLCRSLSGFSKSHIKRALGRN